MLRAIPIMPIQNGQLIPKSNWKSTFIKHVHCMHPCTDDHVRNCTWSCVRVRPRTCEKLADDPHPSAPASTHPWSFITPHTCNTKCAL